MELTTVRLSVIVLVVIPAVFGHLCLISPPQRGSMMALNKPASLDCMLLKAPCGARGTSQDVTYMQAGRNFTFTFQKNLDHWVKATPGYFSLGVASKEGKMFKELVRVPDRGEPSLHLYTVMLNLPKITTHAEQMVLQAKYVTNNANAPAVFYQCADIGLFSDT